MPVIEVSTLPLGEEIDVPGALAKVTTGVAAFIDEDPRGTWAIYRPISPRHFAEGSDTPAKQPAETHPAIVHVVANRPPEQVAGLLEAVGGCVVKAFGLEDGNVFVRFDAADPERMFWG